VVCSSAAIRTPSTRRVVVKAEPAEAAAAAPRPRKKQRTQQERTLEASGQLVSSASTPSALPSFNPYTHLLEACVGPAPLCLVMEAARTEEVEDGAEELPADKVMAPLFIHFIDEEFK
jgi:hypothetical protein